MKILSIDQSYTSCGIIVLEDDELLYAERFVTDAKLDIYERAAQVATRTEYIASKFYVDLIALEGLAFSKVGNATRDLAGLQFVIIFVLRFLNKYAVKIIPPNAVKKVATGMGNAKKEQLLESLPKDIHKKFLDLGVKKTTGLLDLTDAYWIGRAAQLIVQENE
jgi:Holliday junction resolvasome RuvABC endonuclease subunit